MYNINKKIIYFILSSIVLFCNISYANTIEDNNFSKLINETNYYNPITYEIKRIPRKVKLNETNIYYKNLTENDIEKIAVSINRKLKTLTIWGYNKKEENYKDL